MWEQIRENRLRSILLTVSMGLLLLAVGYFLGIYFFESGAAGLVIALVIWLVMNLVAYFQGDSILLAVSGARRIGPDDHPRLYNIVEEMKIASGLEKLPDVYIIDDPAPNAFATGRSPQKASLAVTSGLLEMTNRDELQGVVGHEVAHIKNRDVLLMSVAGILLGTIVILAWYASRMLLFSGMSGGRRDSRRGGGQGQIILLVVGLVLMILAPIAAQLLYFAISRRREYLADASSALYTRYPEGLASALEKIAGSSAQMKKANQATAPMYTVNPFRKKGREANDWSSTHPPISERVRILRAMGGASYADYARSFQQVHGGNVMPPSALAAAGVAPLRAPSREEAPARLERTRETTDLVQRLEHYRIIDCGCGTRLKIPPDYKGPEVRCPACGERHPAA
ncbi:MAG: M48 family metallopeptidase [Chloroflexi bacterium]|nr:M48 family metallopeptidase [Chloroflexota bacterium]